MSVELLQTERFVAVVERRRFLRWEWSVTRLGDDTQRGRKLTRLGARFAVLVAIGFMSYVTPAREEWAVARQAPCPRGGAR